MSTYNIHGSSVNFSDFDKLISQQAPTIDNSEHEFSNLAKKMGPADEGNPDIPAGFTYFGQLKQPKSTFHPPILHPQFLVENHLKQQIDSAKSLQFWLFQMVNFP